MDLIESIRQMMAGENYSGAETALELALICAPQNQRNEIIPLYLEALLLQKKYLPDHLVAEIINFLWEKNPADALTFFENASDSLQLSRDSRVLIFRMKLAEKRGHIKELHDLLSEFHLRLFERNVPSVPGAVTELVQKYFRADFQLRLQALAVTCLRKDHHQAEEQIRSLILDAFEKSTAKILRQKLEGLLQVLASQSEKGPLEIYQSFLHVLVNGFTEKRDFKRLAECIIYFDDFRFNVILMNALAARGYPDLCAGYAIELGSLPDYDFVYVAKHFPKLKPYFVAVKEPLLRAESWESPDLTLTEGHDETIFLDPPCEQTQDEILLIHLVRGQEFTDDSLLDLAVSFVQSELPRVAIAAAMTVHERTPDSKTKLKAAYLALSSLLLSGDYRKALDLALESMKLVSTTDDLLSFLYCEAEAYLRLGMNSEARQVLQKIISIDSRYRMARERLEKLS